MKSGRFAAVLGHKRAILRAAVGILWVVDDDENVFIWYAQARQLLKRAACQHRHEHVTATQFLCSRCAANGIYWRVSLHGLEQTHDRFIHSAALVHHHQSAITFECPHSPWEHTEALYRTIPMYAPCGCRPPGLFKLVNRII